MSRWIKYNLRPSKQYEATELKDFYQTISKWIESSKTGRIKLKIVSPLYFAVVKRNPSAHRHIQIKIKNKNDVALFLMFFSDYIFEPRDPNVIIPIIRRMMPSIIASEICGVQPMTGPAGSIFSLKARYNSNSVTNV